MATATHNARGPRVPLLNTQPPEPEPQPQPAGTPNLDAAVLRVQAEAAKLIRNALGQIGSRSYKYVTLGAVVDETLPLCVTHNLLWKTFPTTLDNGAPGLRYRMTHVPTGEYDEDTMATPCDPTMQGLGSGITYARRYALHAYLNLTVDEDDDGMSANSPHANGNGATAPPTSQPTAPRTTAQPAKPSERDASGKQKGAIRARLAAGGADRRQGEAIVNWLTGKAHVDRLASREASHVIGELGEDGARATEILLRISTLASEGDERARVIAERYLVQDGSS